MKIIITGGAGFIGSHLIHYWLDQHPEDTILNLDNLTYAADLAYLRTVDSNPRYSFQRIDIRDQQAVLATFNAFQPEGVIHLAAESHVDNSIQGPEAFVTTNVLGTFHLLEAARQLWKPHIGLSTKQGTKPITGAQYRFHHVSTDEVYGSLGANGMFSESSPYSPRSPYSASKAGSDHLVSAYHHTYQLNTVKTHCSNNFGPHQHDEKLIPTVIRNAVQNQAIPIYGTGQNVRDWLYVLDHCRAIDLAFHRGQPGESYNIGANNEWSNLALVTQICELLNQIYGQCQLGDYRKLITHVQDRPGHDFRYAIDSGKAQKQLGWSASPHFQEYLKTTVEWYLNKYK